MNVHLNFNYIPAEILIEINLISICSSGETNFLPIQMGNQILLSVGSFLPQIDFL